MTDDKLEEIYIETENFGKKIMENLNLDDIINNCDTFLSSLNNGDNALNPMTQTPSQDETTNKIVSTNTINFAHQDLIDNDELARILKESESLITKEKLIHTDNDIQMSDIFPELLSMKQETTVVQEIIETPLEYISDYEKKKYNKNNVLSMNDNIFVLEQFYNENKGKYDFIHFRKKQKLFDRISKNNIVTCVYARNNVIFVGSKNGLIKTYSCDKENEYKTFTCTEIDNFTENKDVMCITCSPSLDVFASGYENGFIILWDVISCKVKKLINEQNFIPIIALKFLKCESKNYSLIASDIEGKVWLINIAEGIFRTTVTNTIIKKMEIPHFLVECFLFSDEEKENYHFNEITKTITNSMFVVGNIDSLEIFLEEDGEFRSVDVISNPISKAIPDACFGCGYTPFYNPSPSKDSITLSPNALDFTKLQVLLTISWGLSIQVYAVPVVRSELQEPIQVGYYANTCPIIRMGFLTSSILFFIDSGKHIKCINTSELAVSSEVAITAKKKKRDSITDDGVIVEPNIICQSIVPDQNKMEQINIYYNCVVAYPKNLFFIGMTTFHHAELLEWNKCLNELKSRFWWNKLFCLGIDIYKGKVTGLADIPIQDEYRKPRVQHVIKEFAKEYVNTQIETNITENKEYINVVIELCIDIDSVDFLLNEISTIFEERKLNDKFFAKLEPFILKDKMKSSHLNKDTLRSLINVYINKGQLQLLSELLSHLDLNSLEDIDDYLTNQFKLYSLIDGMIYYYMNGKEEYFSPIEVIFDNFDKADNMIDVKNKNLLKGGNFYSEGLFKAFPHEQFEKSKEYLGHKLLWYIKLCLEKRTFPDNNPIKDIIYKELVVDIFLWLISNKVLTALIAFDSYTYFYILEMFFSEDKILKYISSISGDRFNQIVKKRNIQYITQNSVVSVLTDPDLNKMINYVVEVCEEYNHIYINLDLYVFIASISPKVDLDMNLMLRACDYILKFDKIYLEKKTNDNEIFDKYYCHQYIINFKLDSKYAVELSSKLCEMIDRMSQKENGEEVQTYNKNNDDDDYMSKDFKERCLPILLSSAEMSLFIYVKVHLLDINKDYERCIDTLIEAQKKVKTLVDVNTNVFDYIDTILNQLQEKDDAKFNKLADYVIERLPDLAMLSIDLVSKCVEVWFSDRHEEVIHQLDNVPQLQLEYIEKEIEKRNKEIEQNQTPESFCSKEENGKLLLTQVVLLIKLNRSQSVLPTLKERKNNFPIQQCLDICIENKITDACVFILLTTQENRRALNIQIDELITVCNGAKKNLIQGTFNLNDHEIYKEDIKKNIDQCIVICENYEDNNNENEIEGLWFTLLTQLYKIMNEIKGERTEKNQNYVEDITKLLSVQIEVILKQMCCYISIKKIIEQITYNFKDVQFKEFKELLVKILSSLSHMTGVLNSAKGLLENSVNFSIMELTKMKNKGGKYKLDLCDVCNKPFQYNSREMIYAFACGHKEHEKCAVEVNGDIVCEKCRKNEISIFLFKKDKEDTIKSIRHRPLMDMMVDRKNNKDDDIFKKAKRKHGLERLKVFDKRYLEKASFI